MKLLLVELTIIRSSQDFAFTKCCVLNCSSISFPVKILKINFFDTILTYFFDSLRLVIASHWVIRLEFGRALSILGR